MKLGNNFSLAELTKSETAERLRVPNIPNAKEIENLKGLVKNILQPFRDYIKHPITISSGFRSKELNKAIPGSALKSAHSYGYAADLKIPAYGDPKKVATELLFFLKSNKIPFDQLILEYNSWSIRSSLWKNHATPREALCSIHQSS